MGDGLDEMDGDRQKTWVIANKAKHCDLVDLNENGNVLDKSNVFI
jgi:hypothetical protein